MTSERETDLRWLIDQVHVNAPFRLLGESHLEIFIRHRINPEIGFDARTFSHFSDSEIHHVSETLLRHGLRITFHAPFLDLSPGSLDADVIDLTRRRFEQTLRLVPIFKATAVVCHAGYDWKRYGYMKTEWIDKSLETWRWLGKRLQALGAGLVLENVYEHDPEDILPLFDNLSTHGVGFCFDIGHQFAFSRAPLDKWLTVLGPYIAHLHLHDNHGKHDEHLGLGKGTIDFQKLLGYLKDHRAGPPTVTLEPHVEGHLWPSFEFLSEIWPWHP
jgi:sugar phosphate isomerase/epimerase